MGDAALISAVIGVVTLVLSVFISVFISGSRWGQVQATMHDLQEDRVRRSDINGIRDRLARIEAIFTYTLKEHGK